MTVVADRATAKLFLGIPDRWYDARKYRCQNGHISTCILKSETQGDACLGCLAPCQLTFPEDTEGSELGAEVFALRMHHRERGVKP